MGKTIKDWAQSDTSLLEKCDQVIHLYGMYMGAAFSTVGKHILAYDQDRSSRIALENSPEDRVFSSVMKNVGKLCSSHGNYLENRANSIVLLLHAYVTFRIIQETVGYIRRVNNILFSTPLDRQA